MISIRQVKGYDHCTTLSIKDNGSLVISRAVDTLTKKEVCLKTFMTKDFSELNKCMQESQLLMMACQRHFSFCQLFTTVMEQDAGFYYFTIVMEFFNKGDLELEIKKRAMTQDF